MIVFAVVFGFILLSGFVTAAWSWWHELPSVIPPPASPLEAKAIADMRQAVKKPPRPLDSLEQGIIRAGDDLQGERLGS